MVQRFLERYSNPQFLSLGAGFDVTYFWIKDLLGTVTEKHFKYFEVDYHDVVDKKLQVIRAKEELAKHIKVDSEE